MTEYSFTAQDLEALKAWDTPTIGNGLELVAPERAPSASPSSRWCRRPQAPADRRPGTHRPDPREGKTARPDPAARGLVHYVEADDLPTIAVIQDIDDRPGYGAFWGEVQTTVHTGLGVRLRHQRVVPRPRHGGAGFQIIGGRSGRATRMCTWCDAVPGERFRHAGGG